MMDLARAIRDACDYLMLNYIIANNNFIRIDR